jgi:hypothetical protein
VDADVLLANGIGPGFDWQYTQDSGIGGSEYEVTQIAHALSDRGRRVIVANGVREAVTQRGVTYIPLAQADGLKVRALYIERWTKAPRVEAERTVIRATDVASPPYDVHLPLLAKHKATLVCVSNWQAHGFLFAKDKLIIPPMLGSIEPREKVPGRFVFASGPGKGLMQTLAKWRELKARYADELQSTTLVVVTPGHSYAEPPEITQADKNAGVTWLGCPPTAEYRRIIGTAVGLFYVNLFQETFGCCAAFAELSGGRTHILCVVGFGGIREAITNHRLLTNNPMQFEQDFMAAWREPQRPDWYASVPQPDRSPAGLAPAWENALWLGAGTHTRVA